MKKIHEPATDAEIAQLAGMAMRLLPSDPLVEAEIPGYRTTVGEIAAHLLAVTVARGDRARWQRNLAKRMPEAMGVMLELSKATSAPHPSAPRSAALGNPIGGRLRGEWSLSQDNLFYCGRSWRLSGRVGGLHETLPPVDEGAEGATALLREKLLAQGVPEQVAAGAYAEEVPTSRGTVGRWMQFVVPMEDERMTYRAQMLDYHHRSTIFIPNALGDHARNVAAILRNENALSRMLDACEMHAFDVAEEVPHVWLDRAEVHAVHLGRGPKLKEAVVVHLWFHALSEALRPVRVMTVMTGDLGAMQPRTTNTPEFIKTQKRRATKLKSTGSTRIDRTGVDLMRRAGHDVDALLGLLDQAEDLVRLSPGDGREGAFHVKDGKVTANIGIAPGIAWKQDRLVVGKTFPEGMLAAIVGRPASQIVGIPELAGAVIASASAKNGTTSFRVVPRWERLP